MISQSNMVQSIIFLISILSLVSPVLLGIPFQVNSQIDELLNFEKDGSYKPQIPELFKPRDIPQDVHTSSGRVRGTTTYYNVMPVRTYLGIPYAKPPTGNLRFKKPLPVDRSFGLIRADRFSLACIQFTTQPFPWNDDKMGQSEDCLYLNIWVPQSTSRTNRKAVMFWIHGGGYIVGSSRKDVYDGRVLAAEGDVIVVTFNYRLGAFGFLTSGNPDSEVAPGNQALYDTLEALKWTNANIEAFGGDSNKITIFGDVAGAASVSLLCVSPLAQGLFQRAILQSGSVAYIHSDDNNQNVDMSQKLAEAVGCTPDGQNIQDDSEEVVRCLRETDAMELAVVLSTFHPLRSYAFLPMFGDEILPRNPKEAIIDGEFTNVDVLCGDTKDSGSFLLTSQNPEIFGFHGEKDPKISKSEGAELMRKILFVFEQRDEAVQYYLKDLKENDYNQVRYQVYTSNGDFALLCPTVYFAEKYAEKGNNVYFYSFDHRPSNSPWAPWMGVNHYEDIQFVFGLPLMNPTSYTPKEAQLSKAMLTIWSNFAKTGRPLPRWPLYSRNNPQYVSLNSTGGIGLGPHKDNCDFYRPHVGFE